MPEKLALLKKALGGFHDNVFGAIRDELEFRMAIIEAWRAYGRTVFGTIARLEAIKRLEALGEWPVKGY